MRFKTLLIPGKCFSSSANKCGGRKQTGVEIGGVLLGFKAAWEDKAFMEYFGCSIPILLRDRVVFRVFAVKMNKIRREFPPNGCFQQ